MFTGIVECMGRVTDLRQLDTTDSGGNGWTLTVADAHSILGDCHLGDSIAINGTCLTVTEFDRDSFKVGLSPETLRRTNLGDLKAGEAVNLERALSAHTRLGGHFVQGHVDGAAEVIERTEEGNSLWLKLRLQDRSLLRYVVPKGFITLDGTSLTVCEVDGTAGWFTVMLVAYTQGHVVLPRRKLGERVNVEVDLLGKYVERVMAGALDTAAAGGSGEAVSAEAGVVGVRRYVDALVTRLVEERLAAGTGSGN